MKLKIISLKGKEYEGEADGVIAKTTSGEVTLLDNHLPIISSLKSGDVTTGVVVSRADGTLSMRDSEAIVRTFQMSDVARVERQAVSLMPVDLVQAMSEEELVDLVAYLATLKRQTRP